VSPGRFAVIAAAVLAVAIAIGLSAGGGGSDDGGGGSGGGSKPASDAIVVDFAYSPEKAGLVVPLVKTFNAKGERSGGRPVFVRATEIASGEAERRIARGRLKTAIWSPASSLWGRLLNFEADASYAPDENPSLVRTPLVIAMWEPLARALGWPRKAIGFEQILALALDDRGWAAYGRPSFGRFKLGHTNPDFSTSGLSAVAAEYFAATGKREGLTPEDVDKPDVRTRIRAIERAIVHYGDTTLFFADQMKRYGPSYASAVAMEEATLIDYNRRRGAAAKLVGIYPKEGTFFSDNPLIVLDAPWVSAAEKAAAGVFRDFLAKAVTPQAAARAGFRPGDPAVRGGAPIDAAHGADPDLPRRVLTPPSPAVLARIKRAWREDRKPANIVLAVDVSGSMGEEGKLEQAKRGLQAFFRQLSPNDRLGLTVFNDRVMRLVGVGTFRGVAARVRAGVRDLIPDGETAWLDATAESLADVQRLKDPTRINAVVVLTDGEDTSSSRTVAALRRTLAAQARAEGTVVRVYTIAYGSQANRKDLAGVASASGGKGFEGDPKDIEAVYTSISSFF
jgi:Ca-activated chloride channel family protein